MFFVYDSSYSWGSVGLHLDPLRGERVLAFLAEEGLLQSDDVSVARPASLRALLRVHSEEYLETLSRPEVALRIFGLQLGDAEVERVLRTQRLMVGGTIQATRLVLAHGGVAVNLGGVILSGLLTDRMHRPLLLGSISCAASPSCCS